MEDESKARAAVRNLNGTLVKGRSIKVEKSGSKGPKKPSQKLFIGNIAEGTTSEELKALFEEYTPVLEADIIKNYGNWLRWNLQSLKQSYNMSNKFKNKLQTKQNPVQQRTNLSFRGLT